MVLKSSSIMNSFSEILKQVFSTKLAVGKIMEEMSLIKYNKQLISEVKKYPNIYNQKHENYKNDQLRNETWELISSTLNSKSEDVIHRWKNLRDRFSRIKKILISEGDEGYKKHGNWAYLDDLAFLWDFTFHRSANSTKKSKVKKNEDELGIAKHWLSNDTEEIYSIDPASYLLVEQQSNEDLGHQNKRIKCDNTENQDNETTLSICPLQDEEDLFCQSIAKSLRRFSTQSRAFAKLRIQQVLYETELYSNSLHKTKPKDTPYNSSNASI